MISSLSRKSRALLGKPMLAVALALGGVAGMASAPAVHTQEVQPELKPSRDFQKAFSPLFEAFKLAQANAELQARAQAVRASEGEVRVQGRAELRQAVAADLAQLRALKAQIENPSDRYIWGQFAINYGLLTDNPDLQLEGIIEETASGLQTSARKSQLNNAKAMIHFDREEYELAREGFEGALEAGSTDANLRNNIVVTYIREGDRAGALDYINGMINEQATVGTPTEDLLLRAYSLARELEVADANDYAVNLVRYYPTEKNWANAIILVRDDRSLSDEAVLDLQRLMVRTNSVQNDYDLTTLIQLADPRKRPQEVLATIDLGVASGKLQSNNPLIAETRSEALKQIEQDKTELGSLDGAARASGATAITPTVAGDAFLSYGQPAKAEELYTIALQKSGADVAMLKTRIGIAQLDQGKLDEARATFAEVTGNRAPVANLWRIYTLQQGS